MAAKKGFTFVELLIALSLFSVGMLSVLQVFPLNKRYLMQSAMTTQATFLAQQEMEAVRSANYPTLTVGTAPAYEARHYLSVTAGDAQSQYERQAVISYVDPQSTPAAYAASATDLGIKKVVVTIYWSERSISRSYTLTSFTYGK